MSKAIHEGSAHTAFFQHVAGKGLGHGFDVTWLGIKPDSRHLTPCRQPASSLSSKSSEIKACFSGEADMKDKPLKMLPDVSP